MQSNRKDGNKKNRQPQFRKILIMLGIVITYSMLYMMSAFALLTANNKLAMIFLTFIIFAFGISYAIDLKRIIDGDYSGWDKTITSRTRW